MIRFSGATAVPIELREEQGFTFSAEEVLGQITPRTRLLILNTPANPTGGVVGRLELDALVAGLEDHPQVTVLADEISPDSCRLWDIKSNEKLDKDRFRRDLGGVEEAYREVLSRVRGVADSGPVPAGPEGED
jgi:hypothetical protein